MKLSKNWETVLAEVPENVRREMRYYALSDLDDVSIIVHPLYIAVRSRLEADLSRDDVQLRDELKRRFTEMTSDDDPDHTPVRFEGKPEEEEWRYSILRLANPRN